MFSGLPNCMIRRVFVIALQLCILSSFARLCAQTHSISYLGIEKGLSNNSVTTIFQDHYGLMWFGTYDGLNRYNGYEFKVFRNQVNDSVSLIHNRIVCITEDAAHHLWVGTKMGLSIFDPATAKFSRLQYQVRGSSQGVNIDFTINHLEADRKGNMFIATAGKGLLYYELGAKNAQQVNVHAQLTEKGNTHIQSVQVDLQQRVWVFIQGYGLYQLNKKTKQLHLVNNQVNLANAMETDSKGHLWVGTDNGLYVYDINANSYTYLDKLRSGLSGGTKVVSLTYDRKGQLWIATDGSGVAMLNAATGKIEFLQYGTDEGQLKSAAIYAVYEDRSSRKWIGTLRGGINIIETQKAKFNTVSHDPLKSNSLINNFVLSFAEDPAGNLWIGTDGGGLSHYDKSSEHYRNYVHRQGDPNSLVSNNVTGILKDSKQQIWISTYGGGICRYQSATDNFRRYDCFNTSYQYLNNNVWLLYEDSKHHLFAGTVDGALYQYDAEKDQFELYDNALMNVIALKEDHRGQLWAGTFGGLILIDPAQRHHKFFKTDYPVRAIHQEKNGQLWLGTEGGGLLAFDQKSWAITAYTELNGLCSNSVLNILEDKRGYLWLSTFNGLSKFNPKTRKTKNYYEADGLQSNQFSYNAALYTKDGRMLFGGIKGYTAFHPDSLLRFNTMPQLLISGIRVNNKTLEPEIMSDQTAVYDMQEIELPYDRSMLSVDYLALDYGPKDNISYAYYLEGWDQEWNYVSKVRTANYSRLEEGTYLLKIKSTNAEGNWNTAVRSIKIIILPPWYRTWWAYLIYMLSGSALLYAFIYYKNRQSELQMKVQMATYKAEKEKEEHDRKLAFFTNVSHEFRSPLTLIINPVKEILEDRNKLDTKEELNVVYRNARRLLSLVDQLLLFTRAESMQEELHISSLNMISLSYEVFLCFVQQARSKRITYEFEATAEELPVYGDREKIEIILFNLISNALKFAPAGGFVKLSLSGSKEDVNVQVTNNGPQIPTEAGDRLFNRYYQNKLNNSERKTGFGIGLYLVRNFADLHHAVVNYSSSITETVFRISFKAGHSHFPGYTTDSFEDLTSPLLAELLADAETESLILTAPLSDEPVIVSKKPAVMLIDDNQQIRSYIKNIFSEHYKLYEAGSADEALSALKVNMPDLIICDVVMPGITGVELCSIIKKDKTLSHIPFILLTGTDSEAIKMQGFENGADDYITKPFENVMLLTRVRALLKRQEDLQMYFFNRITLKTNHLKISTKHKEFLDRCIAIVESRLTDHEFNITVLASELGMSHSSLYKHVKLISGQSISSFIRFIRLSKAAELFIRTEHNVTEVAFQIGFNDLKYFREQFSKLFGCTPSDYIRKHRKTFNQQYHLNERPFS
jgi:ligand-binding sensor domain-containing protein/signal transduction histidine kinase/DNA-binding response OmpR family regulator